jgi:Na+-transporting NADH:ubiquinone oxidoreductase subunit NqrF
VPLRSLGLVAPDAVDTVDTVDTVDWEGNKRMSINTVKLTKREDVADGTMAFHFEKPVSVLRPSRRILLFYANHRPGDAAFLEELSTLAAQHPDFTFVPTMTKMGAAGKEWAGKTGHITKAMLEQYIGDLTTPIYYITGPASLAAAMRETLTEAGVDDDTIRTEEFTGY